MRRLKSQLCRCNPARPIPIIRSTATYFWYWRDASTVFFPKGEYRSIQMTILNEETHQTDTRTSIWQTGEYSTSIDGPTPVAPLATSITPVTQQVAPIPAPPPTAPQFEEQRQLTE